MLASKSIILPKLEVSYGVDPVPVAADAMIVEELTLEIVGAKGELKPMRGFFGSSQSVQVGQGLKISFKHHLHGAGAVAIAPPVGKLFRASDYSETITPTTGPVDYEPLTQLDGESLTIYFYYHDILYKVLGCRGNPASLDLKSAATGPQTWEFMGLFAGPVDTTFVHPDFGTPPLPPVLVSASFTLDGYAAIADTLKISGGNDVKMIPSMNGSTGVKSYDVVDRLVTAEVDPEVIDVATRNWVDDWETSSEMAMSVTLGSVAGNMVVITAPAVQISDPPKQGERENQLIETLALALNPTSAGNDEIKFSFQ